MLEKMESCDNSLKKNKPLIWLVFYFLTKKKRKNGLKRLMMNRIIPQIMNKPNTGKKKLETAPTRIPIEWMMP